MRDGELWLIYGCGGGPGGCQYYVVGQQSFMRVSKDDFYLPSYIFCQGIYGCNQRK